MDRLDEMIVAARFDRGDPRLLGGLARQEDDRQRRVLIVLPHEPREVVAVHLGQHDVEDQQIGPVGRRIPR